MRETSVYPAHFQPGALFELGRHVADRPRAPRAVTLSRPLRWFCAVLAALAIVASIAAALFEWNLMRGPIEREVSRATGRSFAIKGDLHVQLSLRPRIVANDVAIGNAAWSGEPVMARATAVAFRIDLMDLLVGKLSIPEITLSQPHLLLEVNRSGDANWQFATAGRARPVALPSIDLLSIDEGTAIYRDARDRTDIAFEIKTVAGDGAARFGLALQGKGRFKGQPAMLHARGGTLLHLRNSAEPYPIQVSGEVGATRFAIDGVLLEPLHLKGEQLNFSIEGRDLAALFPIIGVPLPPTPAYRFAGFLDHTGNVWRFHRFKGTMGQSDLAGDFSVDRGVHPQKLVAELVSKRLVFKDLAGLVGAEGGAHPGDTPAGKVLPAEPFNFEKLFAADVDARFRGENIVTAKLPLDKMSAHLVVSGGVVKLMPLDFGVAGGSFVSVIEMDARQAPMATSAQVTVRGLHLARMFPTSKLGAGDTGTIGGRARLRGSGNSVAQMLGSATGNAALVMENGSVGELALRLSNLDIANSLLVMLGGDKQVPVRCLVGIFKASDGKFQASTLVLDTAKVNMTGTGNVDFGDESLHLRLVSQSKGFSLASLRGPIAVTGTFMKPVLKPEMGAAAVRGGLALALGVATAGVGALIPLVDLGKRGDSNCPALVDQARVEAGVQPGDMHATGSGR
jgi:AsmA family protein